MIAETEHALKLPKQMKPGASLEFCSAANLIFSSRGIPGKKYIAGVF